MPMRKILLIAMIATLLPLPSARAAGGGIVERTVSFEVINHNRSATAPLCQGDGKTYTIRGSLVGPAGVQAGRIDSVTLYLHGSGDASTWHFGAVAGVDHIAEMARLGHASVFIHSLGYGSSDPVDGTAVCFGSYADHTRQVIDQLRAGSYALDGGRGPAFERVALAGHSAGGFIAELTQVSFDAADALIVAGWTDYAAGAGVAEDLDPLAPFPYGAIAGWNERCATEPESKLPGGPGGWAYLFTTRSEVEMLVHDIDPRVLDAFIELYEQDPCGWGPDFSSGEMVNIALAPTVDVPVLLANGDRDPIAPPAAVELQRARYALGGAEVSSLMVPGTAHQIMLERMAPVLRVGLSSWLKARGF